jgi:Methyltransferase FkbM domain
MRLDDIAENLGLGSAKTMLKIDVQGGEAQVLAGATTTLDQVVGIVIELSMTELYTGQALALDILQSLSDRGFDLFDIATAYRDPASFRLHQIDAVLFHRDRTV